MLPTLDILFSPNHNIHKSLCDLYFWASDPLIYRFYLNLSIKGLKPKNKGRTKFYESCDLTKKVHLPTCNLFLGTGSNHLPFYYTNDDKIFFSLNKEGPV